ncbi:MAG: hypothetical protein PUB37_09365 [Firmicutes bacterium]|nr:hypothetical protein [Bacillota bacterium]
MEKIGEIIGNDKVKKFFSSVSKPENRVKLILAIGLAAIIVIFLSDYFTGNTKQTSSESKSYSISYEDYSAQLEARLTEMISSVDGAGETKVMVTLECGTEYVYASQQKTTSAMSENSDANGKKSRDEKSTGEENIILIDGDKGEEPIILKEMTPTIAGVVVVCSGADNAQVKQRIVDIVTTALGTSSNRVCVTLMG